MAEVITFQQALDASQAYGKKYLLLGNGFSIACVPDIFSYGSLFEEANFDEMPEVREVFDRLGTRDFEKVIHALENAGSLIPVYDPELQELADLMGDNAGRLKELLISTIASRHPATPADINESKFNSCRNFLANFLDTGGKVYSLNYDLLLYWTLMHEQENEKYDLNPCDGFGRDTFINDGEIEVADFVTWQGVSKANHQNTHYLHGALHLFDNGNELQKFTWVGTGVPLIEQTRLALNEDKFPLFVTEGDTDKKMERITHSAYLYHSYKSFHATLNVKSKKPSLLFTYGFSFSSNDEHIVKCISRGKVRYLFVGLYGDVNSKQNQEIVNSVQLIQSQRGKDFPLEVNYYQAESANVWNT